MCAHPLSDLLLLRMLCAPVPFTLLVNLTVFNCKLQNCGCLLVFLQLFFILFLLSVPLSFTCLLTVLHSVFLSTFLFAWCLPVDTVPDHRPLPPSGQPGHSGSAGGGLSLSQPALPLHRPPAAGLRPGGGILCQHQGVLGHALLCARQNPQLRGERRQPVGCSITVCLESTVTTVTWLLPSGAVQREGGGLRQQEVHLRRRPCTDTELPGDPFHVPVHQTAGVLHHVRGGAVGAGGRLRLVGRQGQVCQRAPGTTRHCCLRFKTKLLLNQLTGNCATQLGRPGSSV